MGGSAPPGAGAFDTETHFALSADLMCVAGLDGYFKRVNPAWQAVLGFEPHELLGQPFLEFVHPDDRDATLAEVAKLAQGAHTLHFENRYRCRDGSYRWLDWTSVPDRDAGLLYAVARDVTQSRSDSERLRQVFQVSLNGIVEADELGRVTDWNEAAVRMFGWSAEEIIGKSLAQTIIPARYRQRHEDGVRRYLASGEGRVQGKVLEMSGLRRDGHEFPIELSISPGWQDEGTVRFVAYVRDLTERHHAENLERVRREVAEILAEATTGGDLAPRLLPLLGAAFGWQVGELWVIDAARGHLRRLAHWAAEGRLWDDFVEAGNSVDFSSAGLPGMVWKGRATVELSEFWAALPSPRRDAAEAAGMRLALGFPVLLEPAGATVMTFFTSVPGPVDAETREVVLDACSRVGQYLRREQTDQRMRAVLDNVADGILTVDAAGRVESINLPGSKILGYEAGDLVGQQVDVLVATDMRPAFQVYLGRLLGSPRGATGSGVHETTGLRRDGTSFPMEFLTSDMELDGRRLFIASLRDLSERARAEQVARVSEDRLQTILQAAPIMLATLDESGTFDYASGDIARQAGIDINTLLGQRYEERLAANPVFLSWWRRALGGESHSQELTLGGRSYLTFFVPLRRDGAPAGASMVGLDISDQVDARQQAAARSRQQAAIIHVGRKALGGSEPGALVQSALETLAETLEVPLAAAFAINHELETAAVMAVIDDADTPVKPGATFPLDILSSYHAILARGGPVAVEDYDQADISRNDMMISLGIRASLATLIPGPQRPIATLLLLSRVPRRWTASELEFVQVVSGMVSVAIQRMRAEEQRRLLLARLVTVQEEERQSIANDIHDDAVQVMTAANMRLDILRRQLGDVAETETVDRLQQAVSLSIRRLRNLLFELSPPALERYGLSAALRMALDQLKSETSIQVELTGTLEVEPDTSRRTVLYRVFQEALVNIRKHAAAQRVEVAVQDLDGGTEVVIKDDGVGFNAEDIDAPRPGHLGITGMRERMQLAGGRVKITSGPGAGTTIRLWMPA
ncbi:MAG: hypothetical protein NVS3B24_02560 [Candidatus Dormibacteria bacterium]